MDNTLIEIIKGMLAPGIMISACGLLLLGMNNKYSLVVNRIRTLNIEFRTLEKGNFERRDSILLQLPLLVERVKLIRNAVWLYTIAIAMFIFSIFLLGMYLLNSNILISIYIPLVIFICALSAVLLGVLFAAKEVLMGFKIMKIETKNIIHIGD